MNYPNLTLKFDKHKAVLESQKSADDIVTVDIGNIDREAFLQAIATKLGMVADTVNILDTVREADENLIEFPELDVDGEVLNPDYLLQEVQKAADSYVHPTDISEPVAQQLREFWQYDVLASALEELYNLLIAKLVLTGSELGVGHFYVVDTEPRFLEKISKEFAEADINLYIPDNVIANAA